jgi:hypothetical protein
MTTNLKWYSLRCLGRCILYALLVIFLLPFTFVLLPAGTAADQEKLDCVTKRIAELYLATDDPELEAILLHTLRYNKIGRYNVSIQHIRWLDIGGVNVCWCPGITVDRDHFDKFDIDRLAGLIIHEGHHDKFPWFFHMYMQGVIPVTFYEESNKLSQLMKEVPNDYNR